MKLIVIDADYNFNKINEPVLRLYGKRVDSEKEENVILHVTGFEPYIYLGDCGLNVFDLKKRVEEVCKGYVREVQIVKRYFPVSYQTEKSNFLKLVLFSPKVVPMLRDLLKEQIEEVTDSQFFEADIQFRNRCIVDADIDGMNVIEFHEKGKEIPNYGVGCDNLYICKRDEIKVLKDEMVKIEY